MFDRIYLFHAISSNFGFSWEKSPHLWSLIKKTFRLDLSISGNFQQLWIHLAETCPQEPNRETFYTEFIDFREFPGNLGSADRKVLPATKRKNDLDWIDSFWAISSNCEFSWQKSPFPRSWRRVFFTVDLSISGNFHQLWYSWQKSPLQELNKEIFYTGFINFRQFPVTFFPAGRKDPLPGVEQGTWFRLDLSTSGNFQELWGQLAESPRPRRWTWKLF